uniref:Predicted protein n=1 Tax=Hordeum vulgare subsp. vulgare TaxID=112509 RepID=F2DRT1_HORVV|nr:predicted protein [Hordeum vulgare subsp. vulgare]
MSVRGPPSVEPSRRPTQTSTEAYTTSYPLHVCARGDHRENHPGIMDPSPRWNPIRRRHLQVPIIGDITSARPEEGGAYAD